MVSDYTMKISCCGLSYDGEDISQSNLAEFSFVVTCNGFAGDNWFIIFASIAQDGWVSLTCQTIG